MPITSSAFVVLLVEDNLADASLVREAFRENRILVDLHHVGDGIEALEFLGRQGPHAKAPRPDLILLDLNMPRMDGRQFLGEVKKDSDLSSIPVVILTTSDAERDAVSSYGLGAAGYIVKPVEMDRFIEIVKVLGDYWFTVVRLP
jgi:CheY-like chemotaxis protein